MAPVLYAIHGSNPCACVEKALELKQVPYRIVELPPVLHVPVQWWRFRCTTVPVLVLADGEEIIGSRAILHRLDELVSEPPLLPDDPSAREAVEKAEAWGDEVLQPVVNRLFWAGLLARPDAITSYSEGSRLSLPNFAKRLLTPLISRLGALRNRTSAKRACEDLAILPALLDRVDHWITRGVVGDTRPNAADLQLAPSVRILGTFADVRPLLEDRPCWALAQRLFPSYPGDMPEGALRTHGGRPWSRALPPQSGR